MTRPKKQRIAASTRHRNKSPIYTYLETDQVERLNALARKLGRPKAELIREAIEAYLNNPGA